MSAAQVGTWQMEANSQGTSVRVPPMCWEQKPHFFGESRRALEMDHGETDKEIRSPECGALSSGLCLPRAGRLAVVNRKENKVIRPVEVV